jgi:hypothetical protein
MFNYEKITTSENLTNNSSSTRDLIDRIRDAQKKRKVEKKLSQNSNTKKTRSRTTTFTSLEKKLKLRKNVDRTIINRLIRELKVIIEYEIAFEVDKKRMIEIKKDEIIVKR